MGFSEGYFEEIDIDDFFYNEGTEEYSYPCPCGDKFVITKEEIENGEEVAKCPSCSLIIRVLY